MSSSLARTLALLCLLPLAAGAQDKPKPATLTGQVAFKTKAGTQLRSFKGLVLHLRPTDGRQVAPPPRVEVRQKGARFSPPLLVVARGQTIRFINDDDIFHNVFSYSKARKFDLGLYKQGKHRDVTFDTPGVIKIHCSIHETMNGTIFVADSPFHATITRGAAFRIDGIAPGSYDLLTWHKRLPKSQLRLTLAAGESANLTVTLGKSNAQ